MSLVLHFRFFKMAAVRHLRFLIKCSKYLLLIWRAIHYYVRTYAKISHASSAIFRTCYLLSVCKIVLRTCSSATMIVLYLQNAYFSGRLGVLVK